MRTRIIAAIEAALLFPALLFMGALVVRELQPLQHEPAHSAHQLVMWYAGRIWTLWILLLALPLTALVIGSATLLRSWNHKIALAQNLRQSLAGMRTHPATLLVAATTLAAAGILVIVALHMAAN
jgi:hypothetical protein